MDSEMENDGEGDLEGEAEEQSQRDYRPARPRPTGDRAEPRRDRPNVDRGASERSEPRREQANGRATGNGSRSRDDDFGGRDESDSQRIDYAVLPPAISSDDIRGSSGENEDAPKPRRRVRRPRADEGDASSS
jgi:hypothetical protein